MSAFGDNLRALRKSRGYTQEKFAELINSNQASITAWECGTRMPSLSTIEGIASILHVPLSSLIGIQNTGKIDDEDKELLDIIKSNQNIRKLIDRARYLSEHDLGIVYSMVEAMTKDVYK